MKWNAGEEVKNRCRLSSLEQAAAQSSLYVYVDAFSQKHIKKVSLISSLARSQHLWASQDEFHIFEENKVAGIILATFVLNRERENFLARVEKTFFSLVTSPYVDIISSIIAPASMTMTPFPTISAAT